MVTMHTRKGSLAGLVMLGSGMGTNPGCIPSFPGSQGRGGAPLPEPRSWLCTPAQKGKSKSRPASQH